MAPKDQSTLKPALSDRDMKLAIIAWQCLDGDVKLQMGKFARLGGYANLNSAQANWGRVKAKLKAMGREYELNAAAAADPVADPNEKRISNANDGNNDNISEKTTALRKRKHDDIETEEQDGRAEGTTPTKKAAMRRPTKAKAAKSVKVEEEGSGEVKTEYMAE